MRPSEDARPRAEKRRAIALDALQEVFRGGLVRQRALRGPQRAEAVDVRDERGAAREESADAERVGGGHRQVSAQPTRTAITERSWANSCR